MPPIFDPEICHTSTPLFTGVPATCQNLPFVRHGGAAGNAVGVRLTYMPTNPESVEVGRCCSTTTNQHQRVTAKSAAKVTYESWGGNVGYQGGSLSRTTVSLDGFAEAVDKEIPCDPKLPRSRVLSTWWMSWFPQKSCTAKHFCWPGLRADPRTTCSTWHWHAVRMPLSSPPASNCEKKRRARVSAWLKLKLGAHALSRGVAVGFPPPAGLATKATWTSPPAQRPLLIHWRTHIVAAFDVAPPIEMTTGTSRSEEHTSELQ